MRESISRASCEALLTPVQLNMLGSSTSIQKKAVSSIVAVDKGIVKTLEALFLNPILAWSTVVMLAVQFMYFSGACMALSKRSILDPAILAGLVIMVYYLAIPGGPAVWGRFRHPAMPLMSVFAAYGLLGLLRRPPKSRDNSPMNAGTSVCTLRVTA